MKIKRKSLLTWGYLIAAGWFFAIAHARGEEVKYNTPEDVLNRVPILRSIPRSLSLGEGFSMKLSVHELRLDHKSRQTRSKPLPRTCMLGLSYTAPVASLTSRIDVPLFQSSNLNLTEWRCSSLGDYVFYMSRHSTQKSTLSLALSARF